MCSTCFKVVSIWCTHCVDLIHYFLVLLHVKVVNLTWVRVQIIQQWRIIMSKSVIVPTDWVMVEIWAKFPMKARVNQRVQWASIYNVNVWLWITPESESGPCIGWPLQLQYQDLLSHHWGSKYSSFGCSAHEVYSSKSALLVSWLVYFVILKEYWSHVKAVHGHIRYLCSGNSSYRRK